MSHRPLARSCTFAAILAAAAVLTGCPPKNQSQADPVKPDADAVTVQGQQQDSAQQTDAAVKAEETPGKLQGLDPAPPLSRTDMGNGLVIEDLKMGTGEVVWPGTRVRVQIKGWSVATGKMYWDTQNQGGPRDLALSTAMKGMREGIPGMRIGGKRRLHIPADKAYGFREVLDEQDNVVVPVGTPIVLEIEALEALTKLNTTAPQPAKDDKATGG